jgi:hypothetical protein
MFASWICPVYKTFETVSGPKIYYVMYNKQLIQDIKHQMEDNTRATKQSNSMWGGQIRSCKIGKAEDLSDSKFYVLRGTVGGRRCTSISSPYRFACGGDHQPRLQSKVLCLSVGERFLPQTEVHVGLEE